MSDALKDSGLCHPSKIASSRARAGARQGLLAVATAVAVGCTAPAAQPLRGEVTRTVLPPANLSAKPQQLRFTWTYKDPTFEANGDGVVRTLAPDRGRLDFFLKNGMTGGYAILVGDSLTIPGPDLVRRFLPPVPLLWATLGRLAVPGTRDTIARIDGDTLRADLGTLSSGDATKTDGRVWRVTYAGTAIARVDRIEDGKVIEWISRQRGPTGHWELRYVHEKANRGLRIAVTDTLIVEGFDDAIWRRP
jgi:hypothetical protein